MAVDPLMAFLKATKRKTEQDQDKQANNEV